MRKKNDIEKGIDKRILDVALTIAPSIWYIKSCDVSNCYAKAMSTIMNHFNDDFEKAILCSLHNENTTLCEWLSDIFKMKKWNSAIFNDKTNLHENYFGRIKNNKSNNMQKETLMAICVGLGLRRPLVEEVFRKAGYFLHLYNDPERVWLRIVECFPGISIDDFNGLCAATNIEILGSLERK